MISLVADGENLKARSRRRYLGRAPIRILRREIVGKNDLAGRKANSGFGVFKGGSLYPTAARGALVYFQASDSALPLDDALLFICARNPRPKPKQVRLDSL